MLWDITGMMLWDITGMMLWCDITGMMCCDITSNAPAPFLSFPHAHTRNGLGRASLALPHSPRRLGRLLWGGQRYYTPYVKGIIRHTSKLLYAIRQSYYTPYVKGIIRSSHLLLVSSFVQRLGLYARLMYCPTSSHVLSDVVSCIVRRRLMYCPTSSHVLSDVVSCIVRRRLMYFPTSCLTSCDDKGDVR